VSQGGAAGDRRFEHAVELCRWLGALRTASGTDVRTALRLGGGVSLWDVVEPFLALYRFPLLFSGGPPAAPWRRALRGRLSRVKGRALAPMRSERGCREWPAGKGAVLVLGFVPTFYRDVLRSVADDLAADGGRGVVVAGEKRLRPAAAGPGAGAPAFHAIWDHWDARAEEESRTLLGRLRAARKAIVPAVRAAAAGGRGPRAVDPAALAAEWSWLFAHELRRLGAHLAAARHILVSHRPALIVSADDADQRCRVFSLAGKALGIPSLLVQQGLSTRDYPEWRFFSPDKVAAMNESSRTDMIAQGVPPERIVVTGQPGFDRFLVPAPGRRERVRAALGVGEGRTMVLFASQPYQVGAFRSPGVRAAMLAAVVRAAASIDRIALVVKPHPGESRSRLARLVGPSPRTILAGREDDLGGLILACDVFMTFFSTSVLQALYARKPVVTVDFPDAGTPDPYSRSGATWTARSEEEIAALLRRLAEGGADGAGGEREAARVRFLEETAYRPDGGATSRVARLAREMLVP